MKTVSQAEFARLKSVSRKTVTQWKARGLLSMTPDGLVKVEESEWLLADRPANYRGGVTKGRDPSIAKAREKLAAKPDETPEQAAERIVLQDGQAPYDHAEAVRIKENYLALLRQLEYDMKRGALVSIEDVASAVTDQFARIRNKNLAMSTRVAPRAAVLRSAEEVKALIDEEVYQLLQELSLDGHGCVEPELLAATLKSRFAAATN